jgi:ABC-type Mn2+/Zn2+ transport system ATPase subunit
MTEPRLRAEELTLAYDKRVVADKLDVGIADGSFTVIIGPNACGKSTLLKALARVLKPQWSRSWWPAAGSPTSACCGSGRERTRRPWPRRCA